MPPRSRLIATPLLFASFLRGIRGQTVDASTLQGKVVYGYQAWFRAPNEPGSTGNIHWATTGADIDESTNNWPDVSQIPSECLFDTGFSFANGTNAQLYSNNCEGTADTHFRWMQENGVDGVFEQRFYGDIISGDTTWANVFQFTREKAEQYGRVFAVEYDISDASTTDDILSVLQNDWESFVLPLTESPQYLHENGKPVLEIWGAGIGVATPEQLQPVFEYFVGTAGVYLILGVSPEFYQQTDYLPVLTMANSFNPWVVGAYCDESSYSGWHGAVVTGMSYLQENNPGITYGIGWFPGSSDTNLARNGGGTPPPYNLCPRDAGSFFELQVNQSLIDKPYWAFVAMFDEANEGDVGVPFLNTAELPVTTSISFVGRDADGTEVPSAFYLGLAGQAGASLKAALGVGSGTVAVTFDLQKVTIFGEEVYITGSIDALSDWSTDPSQATLLSAADYTASDPLWFVTIDLPAETAFQYKFFIIGTNGTVTWEADPNRSYTTGAGGSSASLSLSWQD